LQKQEDYLKSTLTSKVQALKEATAVMVEGLPQGYNQLML
jgi:hypothetical protein